MTGAEITERLRAAGCVFAEDEAALLLTETSSAAELDAMVRRRSAGEPLEHVLGWAEFLGRRVRVEAGVFVPRARTEWLAQRAIELARPGFTIADVCCGSAAVAVAIAAAVHPLELHACDVEPAAVACARRNLRPWDGLAYEGDLLGALPGRLRGRVDLIVANVPYVPSDEVRLQPAEARLHEPLVTLDGGGDGLDVLRRLAADVAAWLAPGGWMLSEVAGHQVPAAERALQAGGLESSHEWSEEHEVAVVAGRAQRSNGAPRSSWASS